MLGEFATRADRYNLLKLLLNFSRAGGAPEQGAPAVVRPIDAGGKRD
jgi:hypothetical protein